MLEKNDELSDIVNIVESNPDINGLKVRFFEFPTENSDLCEFDINKILEEVEKNWKRETRLRRIPGFKYVTSVKNKISESFSSKNYSVYHKRLDRLYGQCYEENFQFMIKNEKLMSLYKKMNLLCNDTGINIIEDINMLEHNVKEIFLSEAKNELRRIDRLGKFSSAYNKIKSKKAVNRIKRKIDRSHSVIDELRNFISPDPFLSQYSKIYKEGYTLLFEIEETERYAEMHKEDLIQELNLDKQLPLYDALRKYQDSSSDKQKYALFDYVIADCIQMDCNKEKENLKYLLKSIEENDNSLCENMELFENISPENTLEKSLYLMEKSIVDYETKIKEGLDMVLIGNCAIERKALESFFIYFE